MDSKAFRRPQNGNVPLFLFFFLPPLFLYTSFYGQCDVCISLAATGTHHWIKPWRLSSAYRLLYWNARMSNLKNHHGYICPLQWPYMPSWLFHIFSSPVVSLKAIWG